MNRELPRVLVTGGAGYVGSLLTPRLLEAGYQVTVYDILYFGKDHLPLDHPRLELVHGDIRDTYRLSEALSGVDAVVHLACISNDASFELDEALSRTINYDAFEPMVLAAKAAGVRRFVYASSSSVYGVSDSPDVTEEHPLVPLTLYNRFKGMCEPLLLRQASPDFTAVVIRPATICGYAPRCRLDLSVNILTNHAVAKRVITVFGGAQMRPNLHIEDMCDAYLRLLAAPADSIQGEIFNCGYQNHTIREIADQVKQVVSEEFPEAGMVGIETTASNDNRSYHINSDKIARVLGFRPRRSVGEGVRSLCAAFREGRLPESFARDWYYNVRTMKALGAH